MKGRRTIRTYIVKEAVISSSDQMSGYHPYRNLSKSQLGAVIFCCQNNTIVECLSKQLFGLPTQHFIYVKNIKFGLPLFLFNCSDRKLYGIFEAASPGQLNIDPYAWTCDGSQRTQYPAQVQIRVRMQCRPLMEDQLRKIIDDNYYDPSRFWLELDHSQTSRLLAMMSALFHSPIDGEKQTMLSNFLPPYVRESLASSRPSASSSGAPFSSQMRRNHVEDPSCSNDRNADVDGVLNKLKELCVEKPVDDFQLEEQSGEFLDPHLVIKQLMQEVEDLRSFKMEQMGKMAYLEDTFVMQQLMQEVEDLRSFKKEQLGKMVYLEDTLAEKETEIIPLGEQDIFSDQMSNTPFGKDEIDTAVSLGLNIDDKDVIFLIGGYNGESWLSTLDLLSPSKDTLKSLTPMSCVRSYAAVTVMEDKLFMLGGGDGNTWYNSVELYDREKDMWSPCPSLRTHKGSLGGVTLNGKIYAVGGGDGVECFSDVEMFDPNVGRWIKTQSMLKKRFAFTAVELNGAIYAIGGYDGKEYLKSVERFDPRSHPWRKIENMNRCRGCHSVSILNEKLYVLGGYDGTTMVRSVEVFDPRRGCWAFAEPMNQARGYSPSISLNGSIYVLGGIKDEDIIETVEVYNEVLGLWRTTNIRAAGKRCFFSALPVRGWVSGTDF